MKESALPRIRCSEELRKAVEKSARGWQDSKQLDTESNNRKAGKGGQIALLFLCSEGTQYASSKFVKYIICLYLVLSCKIKKKMPIA